MVTESDGSHASLQSMRLGSNGKIKVVAPGSHVHGAADAGSFGDAEAGAADDAHALRA
jgi:hypothetical protein